MTVCLEEGNLRYDTWELVEAAFDPMRQQALETVFTIGNGYLSTRGSFEEGYPDTSATTLLHGVFDDVPILYTELANCPDWLACTILVGGDRFQLDQGDILSYRRVLNLQHGVLKREIDWQSPSGHRIEISFERFARMDDPHLLGIEVKVKSRDYQGALEIQTSLNGYTDNQGYNHWDAIGQSAQDQTLALLTKTRNTLIELGIAATVEGDGQEESVALSNVPGYPTSVFRYQLEPDQEICLHKKIAIFTSRDTSEPLSKAKEHLADFGCYDLAKTKHSQAWEMVWEDSDVLVEGDIKAQLAIRYNLFQILICGPKNDDRVSIAAKTLSGFGYRGHVFWDTEIFILPFFNFTQPAIVRNLLSYRYHTLEGARRKAQHYGYKGAMYAWESAATGDEVTPRWAALNSPYAEDIRIWCRDLEVHISSDIAFAIWNYWKSTGDDQWICDYGAEIIFDTAIFWTSRVEHNPETGQYDLRNVIGADEYHEHVDNNVFTNRLVQWHLEKALLIHHWLSGKCPEKAQALDQQLGIDAEVLAQWQDVAQNILILFDYKTQLMEQFEGFFNLKQIKLEEYEPRQQSMQSILGIDGANASQVLKQPDVLMLLYLMRESEEFPYSASALKVNWDYYLPRTDTTYGSSLGPAIHSILASDLNLIEEAYHHFLQAALVDLEDLRGNAKEGIHGASAGAVWQAAVFGFGGTKFTPSGPVVTPHLPEGWSRLRFKLNWKNQWHCFDIHRNGSPSAQVSGPVSAQVSGQTSSETSSGADSQTEAYQPLDYRIEHQIMNDSTHGPGDPALDANLPHARQGLLNIQGVIFDLDGVITDTAEYHYLAWKQLADEEGLTFDRTTNEALRGIPRRESLLYILGDRQVSEAELEAMMDRKNGYYVDFIQSISPKDLLQGSLEILEAVKQANLKIGLGSASKNARSVLHKLGITHYFDFIADGKSVQQSKPAPDLFLFAAQNLGIDPQQTLVFEDAAAGIAAAHAAHMWSIGLGPQERVGEAHVILPSLAHQSWQGICAQLSQVMGDASIQEQSPLPSPVGSQGAIA